MRRAGRLYEAWIRQDDGTEVTVLCQEEREVDHIAYRVLTAWTDTDQEPVEIDEDLEYAAMEAMENNECALHEREDWV